MDIGMDGLQPSSPIQRRVGPHRAGGDKLGRKSKRTRSLGKSAMRDKTVESSCAAEIAICLVQGKWRIEILCVKREGPIRHGQLGRLIPSASKKVLTENLRKLHSAELIVRNDLSSHILNVEYDLAEPVKAAIYDLLD
jgi:DNA-binding HxlR family transcriptional regulator